LKDYLQRFIDMKYAANDDFARMLGFIIAGNPEEIIKKLLNKKCLEQNLSFQSKHIKTNNTEIHILHLFFDLRA